ncbi:WD40 repeat protein [Sorochytrium milnesiophthora]
MYIPTQSARYVSIADDDLAAISKSFPLLDASHIEDEIIGVAANREGSLFVSFGVRSLYLWTAKPSIVVSKVIRSHTNVQQDGENSKAFWHPHSSMVFVVTTAGLVHVYQVTKTSAKSFTLRFQTEHHYNRGISEGKGVQSLSLRYNATIKIGSSPFISGLCLDGDDLFLTTGGERPALHTYVWEDEEFWLRETVTLDSLIPTSPCAIIKLTQAVARDLFCALLSDGRVFVLYRKQTEFETSEEDLTKSEWTSFPVNIPCETGIAFVIDMAINMRFSCLTVILRSFQLMTFDLMLLSDINRPPGNDDIVDSILSHTIDIPHGSSSEEARRAALRVSDDGYAIALGIADVGVFAYSVYGRPLFQMAAHALKDDMPVSPQDEGLLKDCFPAGAADLDNVRNPYLLSSEHVLIRSSKFISESEDLSDYLLKWSSVKLPSMYLLDNWPIRTSAMNKDGRLLAVAGQRGLAHYSFQLVSTSKANSSLSPYQEQSFVCHALVWYRHICIAAVQIIETGQCQLLCLSRDTNLDLSLAVHVQDISGVPIAMNMLESQLYLFTDEGLFTVYSTIGEESFSLRALITVRCQDFIDNPWTVHGITSVPPVSDILRQGSGLAETLTLLTKGRVVCCQIKNQVYPYKLQERVEFFAVSDRAYGPLYNALWLETGSVSILYPNVGAQLSKGAADQQEWHTDITSPEQHSCVRATTGFLPLSISMRRGVIFGVLPEVSFKKAFGLAYFGIETKKLLFLPCVLEHLIRRGMASMAVAFINQYAHEPHLEHALEMLLHGVWEKESDTSAGYGPDAILPDVIRFLRLFPSYLDVIVNCVRKTELSLWDYLFSIVGSPRALFEECIVRGKLRTATSYLVVLHNLESHSISSKVGPSPGLCLELVRFLSSVGGPGTGIRLWETMESGSKEDAATQLQRSTSTHVSLSNSTDRAGPQYHLEILVSRHARTLLTQYRIRAFYNLVKAIGFPVERWIRKERNRSAHVYDHSAALKMAHKEFNWTLPHDMPLGPSELKRLTWRVPRRHTISIPAPPPPTTASGDEADDSITLESAVSSPQIDDSDDAASHFSAPERADSLRHAGAISPASTSGRRFQSPKRRAMSMMVDKRHEFTTLQVEERTEMSELASIMMQGGCYGWFFILTAMTFGVQAISETLEFKKESNSAWQAVRLALIASKSAGYIKLTETIDRLVKETQQRPTRQAT